MSDPELHTLSRACGTATLRLREGTRDHEVAHEVWSDEIDAYRFHPGQVGFSGVCVDIGAHIGCFSLLAAVCGAKRVVAVEPEPDNYAALEYNLKLNEAGKLIEAQRAAVWWHDGEGQVAAGEGPDTVVAEHGAGSAKAVVPMVRLDTIWEWHGIRSVDLLKVDTEGSEPEVIAGASDEVLWSVRRIAMELHGPELLEGRRAVDPEDQAKMLHRLSDFFRLEVIQRTATGGMLFGERH